jgi:WD40 repeat protein
MLMRLVPVLIVALISWSQALGQPPKVDLFGDPLPEGAVARMGSIRLRHPGLAGYRFLPDSRLLTTVGTDRTVRLWDALRGRELRRVTLQGTAPLSRDMTLSPDRKTVAAHQSTENRLLFWDAETGKELKALPGPDGDVQTLFFSADSKHLALALISGKVVIWDWANEKSREIAITPRKYKYDSAYHAAYSPDGKWFAVGGGNEPVEIIDLTTDKITKVLREYIRASAFSPDGRRLVTTGTKKDHGKSLVVFRILDTANWNELAEFTFDQKEGYLTLRFSPDGQTLACGFSDASMLMDVSSGKVLKRFEGRPVGFLFSPDGKLLVANVGLRVAVWDVKSGNEIHIEPGDFGGTAAIAVSPDGKYFASGDWMSTYIHLWDAATGKLVHRLPIEGKQFYTRNVAFTADSKTVVGCVANGFLQFWDVESGASKRTLQLNVGQSDSVQMYNLFVMPDGKHVCTFERQVRADEPTQLTLWEMDRGSSVYQWERPGPIRHAALLPSQRVVYLGKDGAEVMPLATGEWKSVPGKAEKSLSVTPDGQLLAVRRAKENQSEDVAILELASGKEVAVIPSEAGGLHALTADRERLVTTDDREIKVWDIAKRLELKRWALPITGRDLWGRTPVMALVLSPDGTRAVTVMTDGTALVWDVAVAGR